MLHQEACVNRDVSGRRGHKQIKINVASIGIFRGKGELTSFFTGNCEFRGFFTRDKGM